MRSRAPWPRNATDRRGPLGFNTGDGEMLADWTFSVGGTGAATCVAGGVAALALARDPASTTAELKTLLVTTARPRGAKTTESNAARLVIPEAAARAAVQSAERRRLEAR